MELSQPILTSPVKSDTMAPSLWSLMFLQEVPKTLEKLAPFGDGVGLCQLCLVIQEGNVTASLYWQWSQNSKNMRESLYTSLMTIAGSDSCSYGTANVAHLLIVKLMGHSIYYFEALLPQCLVQQLPIYNRTTFTCHNHN